MQYLDPRAFTSNMSKNIIFRICLVEEFESCCLGVFDMRMGENVCENVCNVV